MGKRSSFERVPRDFYPTPYEAVVPLLAHLPKRTYFVEPCAGDGRLVDHLEAAGHFCVNAYDIEPRREDILQLDARKHGGTWADYFITNPPWERETLHGIIAHLSDIRPTWLLFDADWMHTRQSAPYMPYCRKIVSVGRVKWIHELKSGRERLALPLDPQLLLNPSNQLIVPLFVFCGSQKLVGRKTQPGRRNSSSGGLAIGACLGAVGITFSGF